ncbi:MAG: hypothetical protein AB7F50_07485 [Fimbriimonadaceae bacterium]
MRVLGFVVFFLLWAVAPAQVPDHGGAAQREAIKKLDFLVGSWKGKGWVEVGGQKREFDSTESVAMKAGGTVLQIEGRHTMDVRGHQFVIHDAYGVVTFDPAVKVYKFWAQLASGQSQTYSFIVGDTTFSWHVDGTPMGDVDYTMTLTSDGRWLEKGMVRQPDGTLKQVFELDLAKTNGARDSSLR